MSKSNDLENDLVALIFNDTALPWAAATDLYVSLHTADPGEAGDQTTNEATYGSYARVAVARNGGGWTVSGNQAQNTAAITFPEATGGSETITHIGIGTSATLAGRLLYSGALDANINVSTGIQPQFNATTLTLTED